MEVDIWSQSHLTRLSWISLQRWISCSVRLQALCHRSSKAPPTRLTVAANSGSVCSTFPWSRSSPRAALHSSSWTNVCWFKRGTNSAYAEDPLENKVVHLKGFIVMKKLVHTKLHEMRRQFHTNISRNGMNQLWCKVEKMVGHKNGRGRQKGEKRKGGTWIQDKTNQTATILLIHVTPTNSS